jgi:hypothetical protein
LKSSSKPPIFALCPHHLGAFFIVEEKKEDVKIISQYCDNPLKGFS